MLNYLFLWLAKILYPNGRAFRLPEPVQTGEIYLTEDGTQFLTSSDGQFYVSEDYSASGGFLYRLHRAIGASQIALWLANENIMDALLPDNPNFSEADAVDWYRRYGLYNSGSVSFTDMKAAISQRASWPVTPLNQRCAAFMTAQLQLAGFNVKVYQNKFWTGSAYIAKTPGEVLGEPVSESFLGGFYLGDAELGSAHLLDGVSLCVNYLEDALDEPFVVSNYNQSCFIADPASVTTFASVPAARHVEFRQLLLKLKSVKMAAFLFVNYT